MFVRNAADLENNVVAVERIHEYSEVDQEVNISCLYQTRITYSFNVKIILSFLPNSFSVSFLLPYQDNSIDDL